MIIKRRNGKDDGERKKTVGDQRVVAFFSGPSVSR